MLGRAGVLVVAVGQPEVRALAGPRIAAANSVSRSPSRAGVTAMMRRSATKVTLDPGAAGKTVNVPRLRTVSPKDPGWTRRRAGKGFVYLDQAGARLTDVDVERCRLLVIPPAWEQVWICPRPNGHMQAVGTDDAGRRQYIYHEQWRRQRDKSKHDRVLTVAARLPAARRSVAKDLQLDGHADGAGAGHRVPAAGPRVLPDRREAYAEENNSYGLATIQKQHVSIEGSSVVFDYIAKSGQGALHRPGRRPGPAGRTRPAAAAVRGTELLAYRDGTAWRDVTSTDINAYIKEKVGEDVSAKDFRTWHGTVIAAVVLAEANKVARTQSARKRRWPGRCGRCRSTSATRRPCPQVLRRPARGRPVP